MRSANYTEGLMNVCMLSFIIIAVIVLVIILIIIITANNNNNIANNCGKKADSILIL